MSALRRIASGVLVGLAFALPTPAFASGSDPVNKKSAAPIGTAIQDAAKAVAAAAPAIQAAAESIAADTTWLSVHIHAVRVSDAAGQRAAGITPDQVSRWIARANIIYAAAHVRFEFDPTPRTGDWDELNDTEMNNLTGELPGDPAWEHARARGMEFAARFPRKVVVFFRTGPGSTPTGGGFSSNLYNFVVMPGFDATTVCGAQNLDLFAHELGHYFGLLHTFRQFKTTVDAQAALAKAGNKPAAFDADGLADTPPEPYIESLQCTNDPVVILNGIPFPLQRANIMSYYAGAPKTMLPVQARIVRQTFQRRFGTALGAWGPYVPDPRRAYSIVSLDNGRAVEAPAVGASGGDGSRARLTNWTGAAGQNWRFVPLLAQDQGYFEIVCDAGGQCLGIDGADMNDGGRAVLQVWEGKPHQKWRLIRDEKGDLFIEARHSRKVLGAAAAGGAGGAIEQSADKSRSSQRWKLLPAD